MKKRDIIAATLEVVRQVAENYQTATPLKKAIGDLTPEKVQSLIKERKNVQKA